MDRASRSREGAKGMSVNKENVRRWVDALRSGEYKQGNGALCIYNPRADEFRFCCLGVATQEAIKAGVPGVSLAPLEDMIDTDIYGNPRDEVVTRAYVVECQSGKDCDGLCCGTEAEYLPDPVRKWLGFDSNNPGLKIARDPRNIYYLIQEGEDPEVECVHVIDASAAECNDDYAYDFNSIADAIEEIYLS